MNSPLKEIVPFLFDKVPTKDLVLKLHSNLTLNPPAEQLTDGQLKKLAEEIYLTKLLKQL